MTRAPFSLAAFAIAFLVTGCGTSSTTVTGPTLDRCAITVANSLTSMGAAGGSGRLTVTAGRECTWSLTSNVPWITSNPPSSGQGDGTVDYVVAANPGPDARRGTVAMGGQILEVVQEGLTCRFDLQPASQNMGSDGGSGNFSVEAPSSCSWTPTVSDDWITLANGGAQNGNGSVNFIVAPNAGGGRDGTIRIGGQAFSILQPAALCRFQLSAITVSLGGGGGSGTVTLTGASSCNWIATSNAPWISIAGGASGSGNGTVSFTVQPNTGPARNGTLSIGGQRFTITQQQAQCSYSIAPAGQSISGTGGQGTVTISTSSTCTWNTSDVPVWINGVPATGTGSETITFTVNANQGPARNASIIIGGQSFAVSQEAGCSYSLAPGSHNPPSAGGASSFAVNTAAGCGWTSSGVPAWITGVPTNGTGPQTINFTVAANAGVARSANISIGGQTFAVSQGGGCSYSFAPGSHGAPAGGGSSSFAVRTDAGCTWTSSGVPSWIKGVPAIGVGPHTINFTVDANPSGTRSASIVIGGQTFLITQTASTCSYSLSPTSRSIAAAGGVSALYVNAAANCSWSASGVPGWITGVPASGTGTTLVNFTVASNPDPAPRSVNITIAGQNFTVSQAPACNYSLNPPSHNATAAGGFSSVDVNTTSGCNWTSSNVPAWITSWGPAKGAGTTNIKFTVAAHTGPARSANIVIEGQTFVVSQANGCTYSVAPRTLDFGLRGTPKQAFTLTTASGCPWTATASEGWIRVVSPSSGTGRAKIEIELDRLLGFTRRGEVTVGGQTVTIIQDFP